MHDADPLLRYTRSGGRQPSDDETLSVAPDGAFEARRTVAGRRVGRFAGILAARELAALARDAARASSAGDATVPTPREGATEVLAAGGAEIRLGSNERAPAAWRPLVERVRKLVKERVTVDPVAALELDAGADAARLCHVGTEPLEVDLTSLSVRVVRMAADGTVMGRWQAPTAAAPGDASRPAWTVAEPTWVHDIPLAHGLLPEAGEWLQVSIVLRLRDGGVHAARLFAAVPVGETAR
jgi:hypothetical protein